MDLGVDVPDTATPRDTAELLARLIGDAPRASIDRVRVAVERESYGGAVRGAGDGVLKTRSGSLAADVRQIVTDLRATTDLRQRLRATLLPPSAWAQMRRGSWPGQRFGG